MPNKFIINVCPGLCVYELMDNTYEISTIAAIGCVHLLYREVCSMKRKRVKTLSKLEYHVD